MNPPPPDLALALDAAGLAGFFADCTDAHRREYLTWIAEAKREETRRDRIGKTVRMLSARRDEEAARRAAAPARRKMRGRIET